LEREGNAPFGFVGWVCDVEIDAVVDEERQTYACNIEELLVRLV
jgi:hypothetical protein